MDKTYYTANPDGDVLIWWPGAQPSLAVGPLNLTTSGETYLLLDAFQQGVATFVPWEAVLILSN